MTKTQEALYRAVIHLERAAAILQHVEDTNQKVLMGKGGRSLRHVEGRNAAHTGGVVIKNAIYKLKGVM